MPRLHILAAMIAAIGVVAAPAPATPGDAAPYSLEAVALLGANGIAHFQHIGGNRLRIALAAQHAANHVLHPLAKLCGSRDHAGAR